MSLSCAESMSTADKLWVHVIATAMRICITLADLGPRKVEVQDKNLRGVIKEMPTSISKYTQVSLVNFFFVHCILLRRHCHLACCLQL